MKTTVDIPEPVLEDAKRLAAKEGVTLKSLVEEGLRKVVEERKERPQFRLRDESFGGRGLRPEASEAGWERLRELAYEGRGS